MICLFGAELALEVIATGLDESRWGHPGTNKNFWEWSCTTDD
jgi:hypothetical protein